MTGEYDAASAYGGNEALAAAAPAAKAVGALPRAASRWDDQKGSESGRLHRQ